MGIIRVGQVHARGGADAATVVVKIPEMDRLVQQWKDQGGEQAAQEYEESYRANQG